MPMGSEEKCVPARGYITVTVAMMLVLSISLCLALIEGCRRSTLMLVAECAIDTGMNNLLAEYHRELWNQYGLFFIDTSYGTEMPDYGNTLEHLKEYVSTNLGDRESVLELFSEDFMDLHWDEGEIIGVSVSSDENGAVLRRQITEYMEERLGVSYLEGISDWLGIAEEYELTGGWYGEMKLEAESGLREWTDTPGDGNSETMAEEILYYDDLLKNLQEETLKLLWGIENLSVAEIEGEDYLSHREVLQGSGLNPALQFADNSWDSLLLYEYILEKTGHYGKEKDDSRLEYQTEYILCGMESDVDNISEVINRLFALRSAANAVHILSCQEKMDLLKIVSETIAAAVGLPEVSMLFQILFIVIWAEFEALWDVNGLLEGEKIPLIKDDSQWHYGIDTANSEMQVSESRMTGGLDYGDYLRIFLAFQDKQLITYRLMDVMEMDIRLTPGNASFRMDGCVDSVTVCIDLESGYGYQFFVTRNYGY